MNSSLNKFNLLRKEYILAFTAAVSISPTYTLVVKLLILSYITSNQNYLIEEMQPSKKQIEIHCIDDNFDHLCIMDKDRWMATNLQIPSQIHSDEIQIHDIGQQIEKYMNQKREDDQFQTTIVRKKSDDQLGQKITLQTQNLNRIVKQGFLLKMIPSIITEWQKRFAVLTYEKLYCYQNQNKSQILSCINFKLLPAKIDKTQAGFKLNFFDECEQISFQCQNKADQQKWIEHLSDTIQLHAHSSKISFKSLNKHTYDEKDAITQKQFIDLCQTGDIILLQTRKSGCAIQRFITHSQYDHIAMVVKFSANDVQIFESNENDGVNIYDFKQYLYLFTHYKRMAYRRLHHIQKQDFQNVFLKFVKQTVGRKYDLCATKLLRKESDCIQNEAEDRGYFCSQLVAKAYKNLGLLDGKKSSARYWPVDFTEKGGVILKNGAYFGPQRLIILNKHLKSGGN